MPTTVDSLPAFMRKLSIWQTNKFVHFMTQEELEPIMETLGFVGEPEKIGLNGVPWKEYVYLARHVVSKDSSSLPRPKLPSPRIDGLHVYTYHAFLDAVNFYLKKEDISDIFHIRGLPLDRVYDRNRKFRKIEPKEGYADVYVYREGTLDQATYNYYHQQKTNDDDNNGNDHRLSTRHS